MWNKRSLWLLARIRLRGERRRFGLILPLALYVPHQLLLAADGLLSLLPALPGAYARAATDSIHGLLLVLMDAPPQTIVDVDIRDGKEQVRALVRTCGIFGGGEEA